MKKQNKKSEFISIAIKRKDHDYLVRLKEKWNVTGVWVVISKLINAVKKHLSDEDLK